MPGIFVFTPLSPEPQTVFDMCTINICECINTHIFALLIRIPNQVTVDSIKHIIALVLPSLH